MRDWPVVVTNRCADRCAKELRLSDREQARTMLDGLLGRGRITAELPPPMTGRRSPSGYFLLVDRTVVLPLAADRDGEPQWIATDCLFFPEYRRSHGGAPAVDPFPLRGTALLAHVNFTSHAIERFQERFGAHHDPAIAEQQLVATLAPTVRATAQPPPWCDTRQSDFYLVAAEEFCLPMSSNGSNGKAFDATTCIHRASDLFALRGRALGRQCRTSDDRLTAGGRAAATLAGAFTSTAQLSWHRPQWARRGPRPAGPGGQPRFWIVFSRRLAAPVAWEPQHRDRPLLVLDLVERRSLLRRLFDRLRSSTGRR